MFDTHCHLHDPRVADPANAVARARAAGVTKMLLAGVDPGGWLEEERLAAAHPELILSFGVHPQIVAAVSESVGDEMVRALGDKLSAGPRPACVGEIGLDGLRDRRSSLDRQSRLFRAQLAIARDLDLPVALHILKAHGRALEILRSDGIPKRGGMVHSYSGGPELVRDYVGVGLHISFAGPVTNPASHRIRASVLRVPRERLLVETDAPDQTPLPHQPAQNEPAFLVAIVSALATLRGEDPADLAAFTDENARRLLLP